MTQPAIEIVASWDGNVLQTLRHTNPAQPVRVGPSAACWFALPEEILAVDHELIVAQNGGWLLVVPEGASVRVAKDGQPVETSERHVALAAGTSAEVRIGAFSLFVRPCTAVLEATPRTTRRYGWTRWLAVAAVLHGLVLGMFAMSPPNVAALNAGERPDPSRYINVSVDALAHEDPPATPVPSHSSDPSGGPSAPAGEQGGEDDRIAESGTPAPSRPGRRPEPVRPTFVTADDIDELGAIAAVRALSWGDDSSPFTAGNERPGDGGASNAARLLMPRGPSWGPMDMTSTGVGTCNPAVEDCTTGMIDTGDLQTNDDSPNPGWNPGPRPRRTPPQPGPTFTSGPLSREQVRRTVRQHINEVRFCYEQGLQSRPELEGRVAVSFVITPDGVVQGANVASDSTGSNQVASCVQTAVRRWTFPSAEGVTGVTYPFVFQSTN
jgi:TonB family protein